MKYTRVLIGIIVILGALWIIVGEQISGASSSAFVNAQVVTVRNEHAGKLYMARRTLGSRVLKGEPLGVVLNSLVDATRLNDLEMDKDNKLAEIAAIERRLGELTKTRNAMHVRSTAYREHRLEEIYVKLQHARAQLAILVRRDPLEFDARESADAGVARPLLVSGASMMDLLAIARAREKLELLEIALQATMAGVFLGDGYNDAPFSEQKVADLDLSMETIRADLAEARAHLVAISERHSKEKLRATMLAKGTVESPVNGLFWEPLAADGGIVQKGEAIVRLVDCDSVVVSLSVSEMVYSTLSLGQPATFRFMDDGRTYSGTVSRLAGTGASQVYQSMAVFPSKSHLDRYDVTLSVPELLDDPESFCALGRPGRVFFRPLPLDAIRRLLQ